MRSTCIPALLCVLQNDAAPMFIDNPPIFDLLQRSKAPEADKVVVQAAIADAGGSSGTVDFVHFRWNTVQRIEFDHTVRGESGQRITRTGRNADLIDLDLRARQHLAALVTEEGYR